MTRPRLASTVAVVLLTAACGGAGTAPARTTPSPDPDGSDPSASSAGSSAPLADFPTSTARQRGRGSGPPGLVLTDVRVGQHDAFGRVVLELSGKGTPGWVVEYVDKGVLEGSGEVVALDGDATLQIVASGTTAPAPDYYSGPRRVEAPTGSLTELYVAGTFEGYTQVFAGIDDAAVPFRVFALSEPSRLVVDVRDASDD